jgi:hypothetical protein
MDETVTLRPRFGRIPAAAVCIIAALGIVSLFVPGDPSQLRFIGVLLLVGFLSWLTYWRPAVILSPAGVEFINLFRTRRITWPAIQRIETKYALTVYTAAGKFTAWAAPAPSRFAVGRASKGDVAGLPESTFSAGERVGLGDLPNSDSGAAALQVRRRWESYRDAGLLEGLEGTGVVTTWHTISIVVFGVLVLASILAFVF